MRDPLDDAELIGGFGDYDEPSPDGELDRHCVLAPPWLERRRDGSAERYLPTSPRTLQPAPFRRARVEWEMLVDGVRGRATGGAGPGLWSFDRQAETDVRLARLRAGLAYQRRDAAHLARWMDGHGAEVGERSRRVYELFFRQGIRRAAIARKLHVVPGTVDGYLARLRAQAGSPAHRGGAGRPPALQPAVEPVLAQAGLPLQVAVQHTRGSVARYG